MADETDRPYHHGDLRRALIETAVQMVEQRGPAGVSLRAIARSAGVSYSAPYHHFADLEDLLAVVAASGFHQLADEMVERAQSATEEAPLGRFQEIGIAYVSFATRNPGLYRLMFSDRLRDSRDHSELAAASARTYGVLGEFLTRLRGEADEADLPPRELDPTARAVWSLVHGLSSLVIDGRLDVDRENREEVEQLARETTAILGPGLRAHGEHEAAPFAPKESPPPGR